MPVAAFILERIIEETWLKWTERDCSVSRIILIFWKFWDSSGFCDAVYSFHLFYLVPSASFTLSN
jgi:hypothetical protein